MTNQIKSVIVANHRDDVHQLRAVAHDRAFIARCWTDAAMLFALLDAAELELIVIPVAAPVEWDDDSTPYKLSFSDMRFIRNLFPRAVIILYQFWLGERTTEYIVGSSGIDGVLHFNDVLDALPHLLAD